MKRSIFTRYVKAYCEDLASKPNPYACVHYHGCVITHNDVVIASGVNVNLKNGFTRLYNDKKGFHAEAVALMRASQRNHRLLHECELWVCRIMNGRKRLSRPCPMCERIIKSFGIKVVHYTNEDGNWETEVL